MTKEELTEDIIRRLGLRSFLLNEINSFLKCSTHIPKLENAEDVYQDFLRKHAGKDFLWRLVTSIGVTSWNEAIIEYEHNWDSRANELSSESFGFITTEEQIYRLWDLYKGDISFITNTWTTIKAKH
jgi:hypothetical protein